MQLLFGTRTAADINLAAQIVLIVGLWIGFLLARRGRIDGHANVQTAMVLAQLFFIAFAMATSFYAYVVQGGSGDSVARWMLLHGLFGLLAEISGIYLIIRMRTKWLPRRWRLKNFRALMRWTLALWTGLVALGIVIYVDRFYEVDVQIAIAPKQGDTAAPLLQMVQAGSDLAIHAQELQDAIGRKNLTSTKRHAEHLVNLIEGDSGLRYGDVDIDGTIEDPGDGTGLLTYVAQIATAADSAEIATLADQLTAQLTVIRDNAQTIALAPDLAPASELGAETASIARRANAEGLSTLNVAAQAAGVVPLPYSEPPMPGTPAPQKLTIIEDFFAFMPYEVTIKPGTTVVWINNERAKHTATSDVDGIFDSGDQDLGDVYEYTFTEVGDYPYFCRYHGDKGGVGMVGIIHVSDE